MNGLIACLLVLAAVGLLDQLLGDGWAWRSPSTGG